MPSDYGRADFKEIGKLSSMLPAYLRHCCRAVVVDGTDDEVLDAFRTVSYRVLMEYVDKYKFARNHAELMRIFHPEMMKDLIKSNPTPIQCLVSGTHQGLPKRACLHCPKISKWINLMEKYGTIDEEGKRVGYKPGVGYGRDGYKTE